MTKFNIFDLYSAEELKMINYNFAFLEMLRKDIDYLKERGLRIEKNWKFIEYDEEDIPTVTNQVVIKEFYEYVWNPESDFKKRSISSMTKKVQFLDDQGNVGLRRTLKEVSDAYLLEGVNENIRKSRVKYLSSESAKIKNLLPQMPTLPMNLQAHYTDVVNSIDIVMHELDDLARKYIDNGFSEFEQKVTTETDTDLATHLDKVTIFPGQEPKWPNGQTIREALLYQLNGDLA